MRSTLRFSVVGFLFLFAFACQTDPTFTDTVPGADTTGQDTLNGDTQNGDTVSEDTTQIPAGEENLFQDKKVLKFNIILDLGEFADYKALLASLLDCEASLCTQTRGYTTASIEFDNPWAGGKERVDNIALRFRGNSSACQPEFNPRVGFKISFNQYEPGRRFHNQKKLNFLGTEGDNSLLHEVVAFEGMKKFGLPAAQVGFAWVTVNGKDGHIYPMIEESDDSAYIEEVMGETEKGAYFKIDGYCGQPTYDEWFEGITPDSLAKVYAPKAGTLPEAMNTTLIPFLKCFSYENDAEFKTCFESTIDRDLWLKAMAVDMSMPDQDGFYIGGKNHSLYFRKADNKGVVIMWDKDGSFNNNYCAAEDILYCMPPWVAAFPAGMERISSVYGPELDVLINSYATTVMEKFLVDRVEHWYALLSPYSKDDSDMTGHVVQWYWDESVNILRDAIPARKTAILDFMDK